MTLCTSHSRLLLLSLLMAGPTQALAHHPLNGLPMETFSHGLLSGVGHPLLGFDHLFFVLVAGVFAAQTGRLAQGVLAYVGAMLVGTLLTSVGPALPATETIIALSLVVVGGALAQGKVVTTPMAVGLLAGFGLFHGAAFGGTIAGQEGGAPLPVLLGYLIGLGALQAGIAASIGWLSHSATRLQTRLGGAMAAGVGVFLSLELLEGAMLP